MSPIASEKPIQQSYRPSFASVKAAPLTYPRLQPAPPQFGLKTPMINPVTGKIDDDIYQIFHLAPKNELHVHQSGSSDLDCLNYMLRVAIREGKIDEIPRYYRDGSATMVRFKDQQGHLLPPDELSKAMAKVLTSANLREYFRFQLEDENQKSYQHSQNIAETTAKPARQKSGEIRDGLTAYRAASAKINPLVKNPDAAYILANSYANNMAIENMPYAEYRVSPLGNGVGGNYGANIETTLSSVYGGFEDAVNHLKQRHINLDYGLIILFERQNRRPDDPNPTEDPAGALRVKQERANNLAREVIRLKKEGKYNITGIDVAGDEAHNPIPEFAEAVRIIRKYNESPDTKPEDRLGITIHAGETARSESYDHAIQLKGWESIQKSIETAYGRPLTQISKTQTSRTKVRIGHGLQLVNSSKALEAAFQTYLAHPDDWEKRIDRKKIMQNSELLKFIVDNGIVLEMCPKSNFQTEGIHPDFPGPLKERPKKLIDGYSASGYRRHPAVFLSRLGVKVALSSDNRTISDSDTMNEAVKLYKYAGLTYQDFKKMVMNGFEGAFIADPVRHQELLESMEARFKELESQPRYIIGMRKMGEPLTLKQRAILFREQLFNRLERTG
jgi:adenosine deaminase